VLRGNWRGQFCKTFHIVLYLALKILSEASNGLEHPTKLVILSLRKTGANSHEWHHPREEERLQALCHLFRAASEKRVKAGASHCKLFATWF